jgi:membrane-associated phospholipid phosphatase
MTARWKRPLLLSGVCWTALGALLVAAYWIPAVRWADGWAVEGFLRLHQPWLHDVGDPVARLADPGPFAIWTALLAGIALYRRRPRHALAVVLLLGSANVITQVLKILLEHPRHYEFLGRAQIGDHAFPSGHATASMALAFAAVLVVPPAWRAVAAVAGALFALGVSESVMILAWHFPSDVVGGFLVATASTLATVAALRAAEQHWPARTGRAVARRAIGVLELRRAASVMFGFVAVALVGVLASAGGDALRFADHHTVAVAAAVTVAAMAAALPVSVAAVGARRSWE